MAKGGIKLAAILQQNRRGSHYKQGHSSVLYAPDGYSNLEEESRLPYARLYL